MTTDQPDALSEITKIVMSAKTFIVEKVTTPLHEVTMPCACSVVCDSIGYMYGTWDVCFDHMIHSAL